MGLPNPKTRKPTASEVVEWAKSNIGKRININMIEAVNVGIHLTLFLKNIGRL